MNPTPTRPLTARPVRINADEATRLALRALVDLYAARDARGCSVADMARHAEVSETQFARILDGTRYLHPGQIAKLPQRAYDAVMLAIATTRGARAEVGEEVACITLVASAGAALAEIGKALVDGDVDENERPRIRAEVTRVQRECTAVLAAMDHASVSVTVNVVVVKTP